MTHMTEDLHNSPLPEGTARGVTVPLGRRGGHGTGASRAEQIGWPRLEWGAPEAMAGGPCGRHLVHRPGHYSFTNPPPPPPKKNTWGS